jgi:hypothetical protein
VSIGISVPQRIASSSRELGARRVGKLLPVDAQTVEHSRHRPATRADFRCQPTLTGRQPPVCRTARSGALVRMH